MSDVWIRRPTVDGCVRYGAPVAVLIIGGIAAVVSYEHIQSLALTHGQTWLEATLLPLSIDGSIVAASMVLLRAARAGMDAPGLAQGILVVSVAATVAANVVSGLPAGTLPYAPTAAIVAGLPAVLFIGCAEMAILMVRRARPGVPVRVPARPPKVPARQVREKYSVGAPTERKIQAALADRDRTWLAAFNGGGSGEA